MRFAAALFLFVVPVRAEFSAGAAKRVITPDLKSRPVYLAGFGQNRVAAGVHDDLYARCVAFSAGGTVVVCGVDSIGLFLDDVEKIRDSVNDRLEEPADIVVAAVHDHAAPDTMGLWGPAPGNSGIDEQYNVLLVDRVAEAAVEAVRSLRPASLKLASLRTTELDSFIADDRPPRVLDSELVVVSAIDSSGATIATLVNWANHPETLGPANKEITADYPGYFYSALERKMGGVAVLVNGALGGMQSPLEAKIADPATGKPAPAGSFRKAEILGARVAELAAQPLKAPQRARPEQVEYYEAAIEIPVTNQGFRKAAAAGVFGQRKALGPEGVMRTVVGVIRISDSKGPLLEAAVVPGELYPELSVGGVKRYAGADFPDAPVEPPIKAMMTAPYRMLIGLGNDEIGYLIPKAEWDEKAPWLKSAASAWYGEVNSPGPDAAAIVADAIEALLEETGD
ncbi:MAG: hypothetical protein ACM336_13590 [Acidobacteriota bacterium]